jgi:WD40 repeat protein
VLVVTSDESLETIDLESNSLIEQTWDVDPFAHTAFNAGLAGAMRSQDRVPVVVDLTTGARTTYGLITPTGEQFPAVKIYPEADGIWAFSKANVMARWEGEEMVEQLDLGGTHLWRTRYENLIAVLSEQPDGALVVDLVSVERGATRVVFRVPAPDGRQAHPSLEGGLHVIQTDGILNTYDSTGTLSGEIETDVVDVNNVVMDPTNGRLALTVRRSPGLTIVDPKTGAVDQIPDIGTVSNFGFGRDGELLALTGLDGTVRLWDVEREQYAGLVWKGSGVGPGSPSWYDEATETMWVASSGKYLQIPLDPERWVERACEITSRDLTQDEWDRFVPGNEPLRSACP